MALLFATHALCSASPRVERAPSWQVPCAEVESSRLSPQRQKLTSPSPPETDGCSFAPGDESGRPYEVAAR